MTIDGTTAPSPRRRRERVVMPLTLVLGLVAGWSLHPPAVVGHWDSTEGYRDYLAKYDAAMRDMPAPAAVRDIRTDFGVVRVYRYDGAANGFKPLVLLPGTSSGSPVWADNLASLLSLSDVYTVDLLGEPGMSIQNRPIETDDDKAAWLDQTLAALPEQRFHVVGLSIGGWTAVNLALRRPDRLATLTTLDAIQVYGDMPFQTVVRSIPAAISWLPRSWRDSFNSYTAGGKPVEHVPVADMIESGMQHYTIRQSQPQRISEAQLAELRMPVLAIIAGRSVMHDPATARATAERALRTATVRFYPDASHAINGEYPDQIAADLRTFLAASGS